MANVTFNIIEGDEFFESIHDEFIQLYKDGVKIKDIRKQLGLTHSQYTNFFRRLRNEGEITEIRNPNAGQKPEPVHHPKKNPRNYSYNKMTKRWYVTHCETYYTCFFKREQAERFVSLMRECDWDKSRTEELKWRAIKGE